MSTPEEILEKIRKLNAHAESAKEIGNEEEAQAFAAKVQELLTAYKLSMADVRKAAGKEPEPINATPFGWIDLDIGKNRGTRCRWTEELAGIVAKAYFCEFIVKVWPHGTIGLMVGADTDRKTALFMFVTLGRFLHKLAERKNREIKRQTWIEAGSPRPYSEPAELKAFKENFMYGFLYRLRQRFNEELRPKVDLSNSTAIVLHKNSLARVADWLARNIKTKNVHRPQGTQTGNDLGVMSGMIAANEMNLHPNPIEGTGKDARRLR